MRIWKWRICLGLLGCLLTTSGCKKAIYDAAMNEYEERQLADTKQRLLVARGQYSAQYDVFVKTGQGNTPEAIDTFAHILAIDAQLGNPIAKQELINLEKQVKGQ